MIKAVLIETLWRVDLYVRTPDNPNYKKGPLLAMGNVYTVYVHASDTIEAACIATKVMEHPFIELDIYETSVKRINQIYEEIGEEVADGPKSC